MSTTRRLLAALAAALLVAASCGDDDATTEPSAQSSPETAATGDAEPEIADADPEAPEVAEEPGADAADDGEAGTPVTPESLVSFTTDDGEELAATRYGIGEDGLVLAHMRGGSRADWEQFARAASLEGFHVLAFDFRGYGDSTGERDTGLDVDLVAAVEQLRSLGATDIVVIGASMGATATINVASRLDLAGAVSLSAPAEFLGLPAVGVAAEVAEPLLLVVAENDQPYASAATELDQLAPDSRLEVLAGAAHGTNLLAEHGDTLVELLVSFAAEQVGA